MAEFLLELLSEEVPAGVQDQALGHLEHLFKRLLNESALDYGLFSRFATPRRLTLVINDVAVGQADREIERRGPKIDAPEKARDGFLRSLGGTSYELGQINDKKGTFLVARYTEKGRTTHAILAEALPGLLAQLPWPKSMRWGCGDARWVRPLQSIACLFDAKVIEFTFAGIASSNQSSGHRFMAPSTFGFDHFASYNEILSKAHVMLDGADRRAKIEAGAKDLAQAQGLRLRDDQRLLDELKGLVEWPVALIGEIDAEFMELPAEVLVTSMREHQKYLALEDADRQLAPYFITIANIEASDGGTAIISGNERVLRARLWDAKFFWDLDRKTKLADRIDALEPMVFHAKLGNLRQKAKRIERLAGELAAVIPGCNPDHAMVAGHLCKADLITGMVGEFPELQGIMGGHYAKHEGLADRVALGITEHYRPQGPGDACPTAPVSVAVALADKLDTLCGFFAIGIRPTGSGDPFALRRAALGIIRLILDNGLRVDLQSTAATAVAGYGDLLTNVDPKAAGLEIERFILDRLEVQQRDAGTRHDLIRAVTAQGGQGDMVRLLARVRALQQLVGSGDGQNLLVAYRRAANILRLESGKDGVDYELDTHINEAALREPAEVELAASLAALSGRIVPQIDAEDFSRAMSTLATMRPTVDAFFDQVMVNAEDSDLRLNRLRLLARLCADFNRIANFALIED